MVPESDQRTPGQIGIGKAGIRQVSASGIVHGTVQECLRQPFRRRECEAASTPCAQTLSRARERSKARSRTRPMERSMPGSVHGRG
jgi:hypothetical protein